MRGLAVAVLGAWTAAVLGAGCLGAEPQAVTGPQAVSDPVPPPPLSSPRIRAFYPEVDVATLPLCPTQGTLVADRQTLVAGGSNETTFEVGARCTLSMALQVHLFAGALRVLVRGPQEYVALAWERDPGVKVGTRELVFSGSEDPPENGLLVPPGTYTYTFTANAAADFELTITAEDLLGDSRDGT